MIDQATIDRFWSYVTKTETCWLWNGTLYQATGYGRFNLNDTSYNAHRISWTICECDPGPFLVLHKIECPNRNCVRPLHLYLGTHQDNSDDIVVLGHLAGENNGRAKLTRLQVEEIRRRYKPFSRKNSQQTLATEFGVARTTIAWITRNETWT